MLRRFLRQRLSKRACVFVDQDSSNRTSYVREQLSSMLTIGTVGSPRSVRRHIGHATQGCRHLWTLRAHCLLYNVCHRIRCILQPTQHSAHASHAQSVPEWVAQEDAATTGVYRQSSRHLHDGPGGRYALQQHWERQQGGQEGSLGSPRSQGSRSWQGGREESLPRPSGRSGVWRVPTAGSLQSEVVQEDACGVGNGESSSGRHGQSPGLQARSPVGTNGTSPRRITTSY